MSCCKYFRTGGHICQQLQWRGNRGFQPKLLLGRRCVPLHEEAWTRRMGRDYPISSRGWSPFLDPEAPHLPHYSTLPHRAEDSPNCLDLTLIRSCTCMSHSVFFFFPERMFKTQVSSVPLDPGGIILEALRSRLTSSYLLMKC